jgi:hypothetical protein
MSTYIYGIMSHQLTYPPPETLPDELNVAIKARGRFSSKPWSWSVDAIRENTGRWLLRDGYAEIRIGAKAAILVTGIAWRSAARDKKLRRYLLSIVFELARFFKSPSVILLPDDVDPWFSIRETVIENGASFGDVLRKVHQIGEPCQILRQAIQRERGGTIDGYVVVNEPFLESGLLK